MQLGFIGLGRMGANMVQRLLEGGHAVVGYDQNADAVERVTRLGAVGATTLVGFLDKLPKPRAIWTMVPAGEAVTETINLLLPYLSSGDIVIDGGNSYYKDAIKRAELLRKKGISFFDVGTSGGIWGYSAGYCMMIGGDEAGFEKLEPVFKTLAPPDGYLYCGGSGAGHYAKMVHNGIEYAMLEAYGEGFELLKSSPFGFDLKKISHLWNQGSVVRSWLLELAEEAFSKDPTLAGFKGYVDDSGEGRWTVIEAIERGVPVPGIANSLFQRFQSRQEERFSDQFIAALRKEFGGHEARSKDIRSDRPGTK
jgi:6-phosphogluconate dehydrogenase